VEEILYITHGIEEIISARHKSEKHKSISSQGSIGMRDYCTQQEDTGRWHNVDQEQTPWGKGVLVSKRSHLIKFKKSSGRPQEEEEKERKDEEDHDGHHDDELRHGDETRANKVIMRDGAWHDAVLGHLDIALGHGAIAANDDDGTVVLVGVWIV